MLGRATKNYEPPAQKNPAQKNALAKQLFPSSSPAQNGNIEDQFNKARKSSQSIGAFTGYTNAKAPLRAFSPNIRHGGYKKSMSVASTVPSTVASTSRLSVFSREDSFRNPSPTPGTPIDLIQEDSYGSNKPFVSSHPAVHFDENDFDDDADIDLDMEFEVPTALPMAAPPKPTVPSQSPYTLPPGPRQQLPHPSSSAVTWSSSSPSHKATPPAAKRLRDEETVLPSIEEQPVPRPSKRRTLSWLQKQAEEDEIAAVQEEEDEREASYANGSSPPLQICRFCKKAGHASSQCPRSGKYDYKPKTMTTPKEKHTPWNTTASALREEKKKFKQKTTRKIDKAQQDAADRHNTSYMAVLPITLSEEQERVKKLVVEQGKSVFFTGSAGTGKSVLMRSIIADLRRKYIKEPDRVAVTASTGLAACNIGGVTLHSFGGIGLGKEDVPALVKKIKKNPKAKNRWMRTKILIIDEISMVDGDLFDKLEGIARAMRNNGRPFGGIQLVITGDFFQLPPVPEYGQSRGIKFAFDAGTWPTAIHHTIGLTEVFRQKDPVFANMLNEMRLGKISEETVRAFRRLNRKPTFEDSIESTELFPTRNEVDNANAYRMRTLVGKSYRYDAVDTGTIQDEKMREKLLANMMAPKTIELKKGAQVMLIKNLDEVSVNGSLGKVVAFMNETTFNTMVEKGDEALEPGTIDEDGAPSTAGSITTSISTQYSSKLDSRPNTGKVYPLVQFILADGTVRRMLMIPEEWKIELPNGEVQAQRSQLPLILAWALSIHKAQGQTLERVKIDLKKIFEKGQAYVALSRATTQAGLEVLNFDKSKVMAHPRVATFYNSLYSVNKALQHPRVSKLEPPKEKSLVEQFSQAQKKKGVVVDFTEDEEAEMAAMYG